MLKSEVALQNCRGLSKVCCPHTRVRSKLIVIPVGGIILLWAFGRVWCCNTYKPDGEKLVNIIHLFIIPEFFINNQIRWWKIYL